MKVLFVCVKWISHTQMTTRPDTLNELVLALKITKSKPFYKHIDKIRVRATVSSLEVHVTVLVL